MMQSNYIVLFVSFVIILLLFIIFYIIRSRGKFARQAAQLEERQFRLEELSRELAEVRGRQGEIDGARTVAEKECSRLLEAEKRLEQAVEETRVASRQLTERHGRFQDEHAALQKSHAALQADSNGKLASAEREVAVLKELREEMTRRFDELATAALRRTREDFSKSHTEKLTELLTPFREHVGRFETELRNVHKSADEERARLGEQIRQLTQRSESISAEATNLTRALKGDKQRQGAWGEMILEGVLEASGLLEGVHYDRQKSHVDENGTRWRPDVVVRMPRGKCLVIDSKVSLVAYEAATSADNDQMRVEQLKTHVASVRKHIDGLASKGYASLEQGSVDYVLMFVPIEGALSEAWKQQSDLTSYAIGKGVGLVTPTTLMLALKTIDHIWTVERREQNAEAIAERAGLLYDKVVGFVADMQKVSAALDNATKAHGDAMGKLTTGRGNLVGHVEKLKKMGARTNKTIGISFEADDEGPLRLTVAPGE